MVLIVFSSFFHQKCLGELPFFFFVKNILVSFPSFFRQKYLGGLPFFFSSKISWWAPFSFLPLFANMDHRSTPEYFSSCKRDSCRNCNCKNKCKKEKFSFRKTNSLLGLVLSDGNIDKPIPEEGQTILVVIINISSYTFNAVLTNWDSYQCHHHK